jgi:hypothetical protein
MTIVNEGHSVGLEKEFYVVDGSNHTYQQYTIDTIVKERMQKEMKAYDSDVGPKCYVDASGPFEITTRPCTDLQQLSDDITTTYRFAKEESEKQGLYALGMGGRPGAADDAAGLHVHVGYASENEADYVFHELQKHIPDIIALSANSPSRDGMVKCMRQYGNPVKHLFDFLGAGAGLFYGHEFSPFESTSRSSVIYKRDDSNTVEVRCMDTQGTPEEDTAVAAYIFGIAEKAKADFNNGVEQVGIGKEEKRNFKRAVRKGMEATFRVDGEKVPVSRVVGGTLKEIQPYLERYDCPDDVIDVLKERVATERCGADDIMDIYREEGVGGFWGRLTRPFLLSSKRERLIKHLGYRDRFEDEQKREDEIPSNVVASLA